MLLVRVARHASKVGHVFTPLDPRVLVMNETVLDAVGTATELTILGGAIPPDGNKYSLLRSVYRGLAESG